MSAAARSQVRPSAKRRAAGAERGHQRRRRRPARASARPAPSTSPCGTRYPVSPWRTESRRPGTVRGDRRRAAGGRLDHRDAPPFLGRGKHVGPGRAKQRDLLGLGDEAVEPHRVAEPELARAAAPARRRWSPVPGDVEREIRPAARGRCASARIASVYSFITLQPSNVQEGGSGRAARRGSRREAHRCPRRDGSPGSARAGTPRATRSSRVLSLIAWNPARRYARGSGRSASQTVAAIGHGASWKAVVAEQVRDDGAERQRRSCPARNSGSLLMSSTTTSGRSAASARRTAPRPEQREACAGRPTRSTAMPSTVAAARRPASRSRPAAPGARARPAGRRSRTGGSRRRPPADSRGPAS